MTTHTAPQLAQPTPSATHGTQIAAATGKVTIASGVTLTAADTVLLVKLPAYHVPVDLILDLPDLDGGSAALLFRVGFIGNATGNDDDAFIVAGNTTGQAGGIVHANAPGFTNIAPASVDRIIGMTVNTTAGGATAAAGVIHATLLCRQQQLSLGD